MKRSILFTILLLFCLIISQIAAEDSGLHKGWELGQGHETHQGNGFGHDMHGCDATCPLCGGNPCVPPCPGA